ncbi:MAG: hypothetical protein DRH08_14865 [Deltaproteobacteria bacterium]|nr:MAG: hypothetical protein DRH08_14865 [Deltaproteobacteria bacterium]
MKILSSKKLRKELKIMWPMFTKLDEIWLTDRDYYCPPVKLIKEAIEKCGVVNKLPKGEAFDCDDFALVANALVRLYFIDKEWNKDGNNWYPIAFGEAIGTKWNAWEDVHSANICMCEEGIMLIEPQHGTIWKANPADDNLFFIKI